MVEAMDHRISKLQEESAALTARLAATSDRLKKAEANQAKLHTEKQQATVKRDILVNEKLKLESALADGTWKEQQITPAYQEKARTLLRKIGRTIPAASRVEKLIPGEEEQYRRVIAKKAEEIKRLQQKLAELEEKLAVSARQLKQATAEKATLQGAVATTNQQLEAYLTPRVQEIQNLWELHFRRLCFSEQALRWVAQLPLAQRLVIERYLLELNELNHPVLLADGEMNVDGKKNAPYLLIQLAKGKRIRLVYSPKLDGKTEITRINDY